jgi:hypothetical protein
MGKFTIVHPYISVVGMSDIIGIFMDCGDIPTNLSNPRNCLISILPECRDAMYSVRSNPKWLNTSIIQQFTSLHFSAPYVYG